MQAGTKYRIRNWKEYNRSLIQRGSVTIWIEEKSLKNWFSFYHTCKAGRPATYSDHAILMMLILREVTLSMEQTESLAILKHIKLNVMPY